MRSPAYNVEIPLLKEKLKAKQDLSKENFVVQLAPMHI